MKKIFINHVKGSKFLHMEDAQLENYENKNKKEVTKNMWNDHLHQNYN